MPSADPLPASFASSSRHSFASLRCSRRRWAFVLRMKVSSFAPPAARETSAGPAERSALPADPLCGVLLDPLCGGPLLSVKVLVEEVVGSELDLSGRTTGSNHGDLQSKKVFLTVNPSALGMAYQITLHAKWIRLQPCLSHDVLSPSLSQNGTDDVP